MPARPIIKKMISLMIFLKTEGATNARKTHRSPATTTRPAANFPRERCRQIQNTKRVNEYLKPNYQMFSVQSPNPTSFRPDPAKAVTLVTQGVGCCPYKDATCCKDHTHCCPHGITIITHRVKPVVTKRTTGNISSTANPSPSHLRGSKGCCKS